MSGRKWEGKCGDVAGRLGYRCDWGAARVMWLQKGPQLGQSGYCSCFQFLTISKVLLHASDVGCDLQQV